MSKLSFDPLNQHSELQLLVPVSYSLMYKIWLNRDYELKNLKKKLKVELK